jgi:hypothetical protein
MSAHAVMRGTSMRPLLQEGMLLEVEAPRRFTRGQIAVFKAGERLVAHRLLHARNSTIVCCGDAHPDRLDYVPAADVVGVVRAVYRSDGRRMRRIDSALFWARGLAFAYLQPLRALFRRAAPHRRERTYALLVRAAAAVLRDDSVGLLHAVEQTEPWRFAATARRHGMAEIVTAALEPYGDHDHASAVCDWLTRAQGNYERRSGAASGYPPLCDVFSLAKKSSGVLGACSPHASRVHAAVLLFAAQLAGMARFGDARTRRLTQWMQQREDLPKPLRLRCECVDAWFEADRRIVASLRAAVRVGTLRGALGRLASAPVIALYLPFMR